VQIDPRHAFSGLSTVNLQNAPEGPDEVPMLIASPGTTVRSPESAMDEAGLPKLPALKISTRPVFD
jgi:hypothetical protein